MSPAHLLLLKLRFWGRSRILPNWKESQFTYLNIFSMSLNPQKELVDGTAVRITRHTNDHEFHWNDLLMSGPLLWTSAQENISQFC